MTDASIELEEAERVLDRGEAAAAQAYGPDAEAALAWLQNDLSIFRTTAQAVADAHPEIAARLVLPLAELAMFGRGLAPTDPLFAQAVAWADASGIDALRARTRHALAKMRLEEHRPDDALAELERARTFVHDGKTGDLDRTLGWARIANADLAGAREALERAVTLHRQEQAGRGVADAFAALAVVTRLEDDLAGATQLFASAGAMHVLMGDRIRAAKVREMAALLGVTVPIALGEPVTRAALLAEADAHHAAGRAWREEIARELAKRVEEPRARASTARPWRLEMGGTMTVTPDGQAIDLTTRSVLRRVFAALVAARAASPGQALDVDAILAAGWPSERVLHAAGLLRVYTAIKRLRALGLEPIVRTVEDGYLLDPDVEMNILPAKSLRPPA